MGLSTLSQDQQKQILTLRYGEDLRFDRCPLKSRREIAIIVGTTQDKIRSFMEKFHYEHKIKETRFRGENFGDYLLSKHQQDEVLDMKFN